MTQRSPRNLELADFLRRARGKVDATRTGLPYDGRIRRVPGLRREEVALRAGVSTDYYTRLEQGRRITPSEGVLDALARALGLDQAGRAHLLDLAGNAAYAPGRRTPSVPRVRPGLRQLLDSFASNPAFITNRRSDILASNALARALLADFEAMPARARNYTRWMFLDDAARTLFVDWDEQARAAVEGLRLAVGADPGDRSAQELVAELSTASEHFRTWWEEHGVFLRTYGTKRLQHPVVGELAVQYESLTLPGDSDQILFVYSTEPASASRQALDLLASWALTPAS
ncbi:helix-turn-helix transcriptional regulator [Nocardioides sp. CER19]|uniref:helix-turn-helix transcriptional regulator n=1 Tax=Nocardioides sp. CER19 TaxID=3038538 RepID=UPI0024485ED9|nr:helix-turn-helix transcriptional regulator [Nocardioides sp. CER19]MDH2413876.1 helix-turn-helix transcriptional regulator [Nocardioides sp. CER19]